MNHADRLTNALHFEYDPINDVTLVRGVQHPTTLSTLAASKGYAHFAHPIAQAQRCTLNFKGKVDALPAPLQDALDQQVASAVPSM